jgi:hypothetical protein
MRRIPQTFSLFAVSVLAVSVLAVVPVSARQGSDDDKVTTVSTTESSNSGSGSSGSGSTVKVEDDTSHVEGVDDDDGTADQGRGDAVTTRVSDLQERAQKLVASERQDKKGKSVEARQKSCESRKASILKRSENYSRHGKKHLEVFNSIYDKVLKFQDEKNLTAENFDTLKATADAKKAAAETAVAAIAEVSTDIDCSAADPAATVASLKEAVGNARKALHEYRLAIKDIVVALEKAVDDTSAEDSTETNDSGADSVTDQQEAN